MELLPAAAFFRRHALQVGSLFSVPTACLLYEPLATISPQCGHFCGGANLQSEEPGPGALSGGEYLLLSHSTPAAAAAAAALGGGLLAAAAAHDARLQKRKRERGGERSACAQACEQSAEAPTSRDSRAPRRTAGFAGGAAI